MRSSARLSLVGVIALIFMASSALATNDAAIHGKIAGRFASASSCFGCGNLVKYVRADRVWCAWQGDNVIIHVRFRNSSVEHLTISWHPSYVIRGGGAHGEGLSSVQDSGIQPQAARGVYVKQKPQGVAAGSPLAACKPSFYLVESG
jgi:hypothetical protein